MSSIAQIEEQLNHIKFDRLLRDTPINDQCIPAPLQWTAIHDQYVVDILLATQRSRTFYAACFATGIRRREARIALAQFAGMWRPIPPSAARVIIAEHAFIQASVI